MRVLLLGTLWTAVAASQTFTVAGVVVDGLRGAPLNRARVILAGGPAPRQAVTTGADGRFSFTVPQGKYNLLAERNEWRIQFGNSRPQNGFGSAVITGPDQDTAHLTLSWYPPAAIFGRVVDENGEPVRNATVQLIHAGVVAGRKRTLPAGSASTDDRGEYRFGPISAGTYYVVAVGRPWSVPEGVAVLSAGTLTQKSQPEPAYPPTYYPGTSDGSGASLIPIRAGEEKRADIPLRAAPGANVQVRCPGLRQGDRQDACPGSTPLSWHGIGDIELQPASLTRQVGGYSGVPPGRYTVRFNGGTKTAAQVVDVLGGNVTVDLAVKDRKPVVGTVRLQNSGALPPKGIYVALDNETTGRSVGGAVNADGTFAFANTGGARFRVRLYGSVPLAVVAVSQDGAAVPDGVVDIMDYAGARLEIVATDELGRLKGVVSHGDRPAPAVLAVLVPRSPSPLRLPLGYQTESDGSFDYQNVPAGDYLLFSVPSVDLEYTNPKAIQPYLAAATPVHIASKSVVEQRIELTAEAPLPH